VDSETLVDVTDGRIKWTRQAKASLARGIYSQFEATHVRRAVYRPFTSKYLYFDAFWNEEPYQQPLIFPLSNSEAENVVIWMKVGSDWPVFALAINAVPDLLPQGGSQCFPYYVYDEDGSNRRENITDWALAQFHIAYGGEVSKRDIFHYVYGLLHHPAYRERYAENLKRELPRIPLVAGAAAFQRCAEIGRLLMALHLGYETQPEYALRWVEHPDGSPDRRVTFHVRKMKLSADRAALAVNETLTLEGIPPACFDYRLGNRSALEWVIDQYQISEDKRSGIISDPNRADDPQYIVRLVGQVVSVSMQTVALVSALAAEVALPEPVAVVVAAE
jgi:predicted helicase